MIGGLIVILMCQLAGEAVARGLGVPIPGPVIGMALLFALLLLRDRSAARLPAFAQGDTLEKTGQGLLAHLSLLFIPAGVGVVQNLGVFAEHGVALGTAIVVSTALALLTTAWVFLWVARLMAPKEDDARAIAHDAGAEP
jgi:holin-like protein